MTFQEVMAELERLGTAQNRKVYKRHGAGDKVFGVSFADLGVLKKKVKRNHALAEELWQSGNIDAQTFATMIADPGKLSAATADKWVKDISYYHLADRLSALIAQTPHAYKTMHKWMKSKKEYVQQSGYDILAFLLKNNPEAVSDDECREHLQTIEKRIHTAPNRARHTMNNAVIAIGVFKPDLAEAAKAVATRIGRVEVDHGETSCKTPDAVAYIDKSLARMKKRAAARR